MTLICETLYCKDCMRLVEGPICPHCRSRKLCEPQPGDFCLVAEMPYIQAEMLKEVYRDNDIPYTERSSLGAWFTAGFGVNVDHMRLYVPFDRLERAKELYDAYFNGAVAESEDDLDSIEQDPEDETDLIARDAEPVPNAAARELMIGHVYRHFKGGLYLVEAVARHSETCEEYVVYRKLYGDYSLWVRPKEMFLSPVDKEKYPDAMQEFRFEPYLPESGANPE